MKYFPVALLACALLTAFVGCGGYNVAPVTGTVTFEGEPLADARVSFHPEKGRPSHATTDAQGHYELYYSETVKGAEVGEHRVKITTAIERDDDTIAKEKLPAKYHSKSKLNETVNGKANVINFKLTK